MAVRYGIIGSGMMGQEHIRNIALLEGAAVTAVADPDQQMRSSAANLAGEDIAQFCDHRALVTSGKCDALVIAAPNDLHHQILKDVLDTDLPILCEKPLCTTSVDCREILQLTMSRAAPVWVAMEYRYMPPVVRLIDEVAAGVAGAPVMMAIREHRFPFLDKVGDWNRFNERTGGTLVEKCCHFWDLMRLVLKSDPIRVFASAGVDVNHLEERYGGRTPDIVDNGFIVVDFANGARGMLDLCMFAEGSYWQEVISVTGPNARIDAKIPGPARFAVNGEERMSEIEISNRKAKTVVREEIEVDPKVLAAGDHHGSTFFQHQKFRDLVSKGTGRPEVTLMDGLWAVAVGEAAEQSARSGQSVEIKV